MNLSDWIILLIVGSCFLATGCLPFLLSNKRKKS